MAKDPVKKLENFILENNIITKEGIENYYKNIDKEIEKAVKFAQDSPFPSVESTVENVYSDIVEEVRV